MLALTMACVAEPGGGTCRADDINVAEVQAAAAHLCAVCAIEQIV